MLFVSLLFFVTSGFIAGIFSGLLGLGGGLTLVPLLSIALGWSNIPSSLVMHLTIGTAMGGIFINSISSSLQRVQAGDFDVILFKRMVFGLVIGAISGCIVSHYLSGITLRCIFIFVVFLSILKTVHKMLALKKETTSARIHKERLPSRLISTIISYITGFQGALTGGGAALITVPFLGTYHYTMKKSAAQASALSTMTGLSAAITYIIVGWSIPKLPAFSLGYIYLPALIPVAIAGFFGSKVGIKISHITTEIFQKCTFIAFLSVVMCTMIIETINAGYS